MTQDSSSGPLKEGSEYFRRVLKSLARPKPAAGFFRQPAGAPAQPPSNETLLCVKAATARSERSSKPVPFLSFFSMNFIISLLVGGAGCFAPVLGLAPVALQATEAASVRAVDMASSGRNQRGIKGVDRAEAAERCDQLGLEIPGTIELQVSDSGPSVWRELRLSGLAAAPQWQPVTSAGGGGWRPFENRMSFVPPLQNSLRVGKRNYLAYAPAEPRTSEEQAQLVALTEDFGGGEGIFQWNGRVYQYALVNQLPCFPEPVAVEK